MFNDAEIDYLLSVAESSSTSSSINKQQNNNFGNNSSSGGGGIVGGGAINLDTTCFDLDNLTFQENQRYCFPVRPIPRQHNNKEIIEQSHRNNNPSTSANSAAAIGVVIPTTPLNSAAATILDDNNYYNHIQRTSHNTLQPPAAALTLFPFNIGSDTNSNRQISPGGELSWEQRLNFIQYFLSLTSKQNNTDKVFNAKMVNERRENNLQNGGGGSEIIVNSTSLEDVPQSEASGTRAHSVTSIHTTSDPNTPTACEELQSKLDVSNRNIQNIKDQHQHLVRLQQAAKQHLQDMENVRNQMRNPSSANRSHVNSDGVPQYESVDQVHNDMENLVNRMKTLTTLIQGQHELSALLGEDGPEVLAEQEQLQRKLEELKNCKQDMKNLVSELQEVNTSAERKVQTQQQQQQQPPQRQDEIRTVPGEYHRVVPIELVGAAKQSNSSARDQSKSIQNGHYQNHNETLNGHDGEASNHSDTASDDFNAEGSNIDEENPEVIAETAELIRSKMADINAMKNQLKRLKDMMESVKMIEEKTSGKPIEEIGNEPEELAPLRPVRRDRNVEQQKVVNHTAVADPETPPNDSNHTYNEEEMSEKVRMLHIMTQDLRDQARKMSSERDRLRAVKEEIKRRRDIANATAAIIDAEKNSNYRETSVSRSLSNTTTANLNNDSEKQLLEVEYEAKKKEFEKLCQRLQNEDVLDERNDDIQEDNEAAEEREIKQEPLENNWRRPDAASLHSNNSCKGQTESFVGTLPGKDSADSGAADVHGNPSMEAASFKSGSSRSYSVPPPMRALNNREMSWRKNSQENASTSSQQFNHLNAPPLSQQSSGMPSVWNPSLPYYYSTPYGQQFSPQMHFHGGSVVPGNEYCSHQCQPAANNPPQQHTPNSVSSDPVLLQQFIQTQQMLINSVTQCNQLLWHQQKEINNLNNALLLIQERLLNAPDMKLARAESVQNQISTNANNNCCNAPSRAQSEQPQSFLPPMSPIKANLHQSYNSTSNIYHHQRRNMLNLHCDHHSHCIGGGGGGGVGNTSTNTSYNNFAAEQQASQFSSTNLCSNTSNQQQQQPQQQNFLNNDIIPPNSNHGPAPIFMHHHNNTITPNNSNLLNSQQNCLNSPIPLNNNISGGGGGVATANTVQSNPSSALNNQVPPGNRANNYWDNFRR